jgi:hypothetical protein
LLEKEAEIAKHQTGHNSGVVHAGVYYEPGSLKSHFCKVGAAATREFCAEHQLPFDRCGKLLVATTPTELQRLQGLITSHQQEIQQSMVGREVSVLVEKKGRLPDQMLGKSEYLHAVHIENCTAAIGDIQRVRVTEAKTNSLAAVMV